MRWHELKHRVVALGKTLFTHKKEVLVAAAIIAILLHFQQLKPLIVIVALVAIASLSLSYNRVIHLSLGLELITLATVLAGSKYGSATGIIVGIVSLLLAELISYRISPQIAVSFLGIAAVGLLAGVLHAGNITLVGISLSLLYNAIIIPLYLLLGSNPAKCGLFAVTNILFNTWVFITIAPVAVRLI